MIVDAKKDEWEEFDEQQHKALEIPHVSDDRIQDETEREGKEVDQHETNNRIAETTEKNTIQPEITRERKRGSRIKIILSKLQATDNQIPSKEDENDNDFEL